MHGLPAAIPAWRAWLAGLPTWWAPRPEPRQEAWEDFQASLAWVLGLQLLDLVTTVGALGHGAVEANPWAASLLAAQGTTALFGLKLVAILASLGWLPAFALVLRSGERSPAARAMLGLLLALTLLYSAAVLNNLRVFSALVG
jgi:hypothetical protein